MSSDLLDLIKKSAWTFLCATRLERVFNPNSFADLHLSGNEQTTLVTGTSNSTPELRHNSLLFCIGPEGADIFK